MDIVERARSMIVSPAAMWPVVEQESTDFQKLYVPYLVVLATIPAVAGFIGMSVIGIGGFGLSMRIPLITGLGLMVSQYVMTLVMVFVWGWLISMLATTFGGQANLLNAVKLSVYASTPALLAGVFHAIPGTSVLAIVGALYSLYLVYLGLPVLMKNPAEKTIAYMVVAAVVGIIGSMLIGFLNSIWMPSPMSRMQGSGGMGDIKISTPKGDVQISGQAATSGKPGDASMTIKTPDGEVKIDIKNMEELAKRMEAMAAEKEKEAKK